MKILAFDTSTASGSIALLDGGTLAASAGVSLAGPHAVWLMPALDGFLKETGTALAELDCLAVTNGPGSFTGLRIGVSAAKGLAWALGVKIVPVGTLEALAANLRHTDSTVCAVLDARKNELYSAVYRFTSGSSELLMRASAVSTDALIGALEEISRERGQGPVTFIGAGLAACKDAIAASVKDAVIAPVGLWNIRAANVAIIAKERLSSGTQQGLDAADFNPFYLRDADFKAARKHNPPVCPPRG